MKNILLIGIGPHAKRIYVPLLKNYGEKYGVSLECIVDVMSKKDEVIGFLEQQDIHPKQIYFNIDKKQYESGFFVLSDGQKQTLNLMIKHYNIHGVIIATEPLSHKAYALRAIEQGLHILMDKPISTRINCSIDDAQAQGILNDYDELLEAYLPKKYDLIFSCLSQRRYHPAYQKMADLIEDVYCKTGCPITSITIQHSDGQWRMPDEILNEKYHGFNEGYGKCSHSGYHFFDILAFLLEKTTLKENIDEVRVDSDFVRPRDFIRQVKWNTYERIFGQSFKKKIDENLQKKYLRMIDESNLGEIDAFIDMNFLSEGKNITHVHMGMIHNGFSQRSWLDANTDLYKGNGRVRHETIIMHQGPFQSIHYHSYQSQQILSKGENNKNAAGGELHSEVLVFRNSGIVGGDVFRKYDFGDIEGSKLMGYSRGHQEIAREKCFLEFIQAIKGEITSDDVISAFHKHRMSVFLLSSAYKSAATKYSKEQFLGSMRLGKTTQAGISDNVLFCHQRIGNKLI